MSGAGPLDRWFARGLGRSGLGRVEVINWPRTRAWMLHNLRNREQHLRAARELADRLIAMHRREPRVELVVTAHSTGVMVTLDALARLGEPIVAQAWFLAAAVHRSSDLRPALGGVRRLCNLYSWRDVLALGMGTAVFGNADGLRGESAGRQPFVGPGSDDERVEQIAYDPRWRRTGNLGLHTTVLYGTFARGVLAPMIRRRLRGAAA
jgi:hypothetical protein